MPTILGWAFDWSNTDINITLELIGFDGNVLYSTKADIYHADLHTQGVGDGVHGFRLKGNFLGWVKEIVFTSRNIIRTEQIDVGIVSNEIQREFLCIHNEDFIFNYCEGYHAFKNNLGQAVAYYIERGKDSAEMLKQLCIRNLDKNSQLTLLEFASGYGNVTRWYDTDFFDITACDIFQEALEYIEQNIKVKTLLSTTHPEDFASEVSYDVIFALSFFSHMPDKTFGRWIRALFKLVSPGGILVFTTHGRISIEKMESELGGNKITIENGFGFIPTGELGDTY